MFAHELDNVYTRPVILAVMSRLEDFARSRAVAYTVKVQVISWKCRIGMLLVQTTNRK